MPHVHIIFAFGLCSLIFFRKATTPSFTRFPFSSLAFSPFNLRGYSIPEFNRVGKGTPVINLLEGIELRLNGEATMYQFHISNSDSFDHANDNFNSSFNNST